jgi:manganese oxidase
MRMSIRNAMWFVVVLAASLTPVEAQQQQCQRTIVAKVAAIDQLITYNRMGSNTPAAEMFALLRDVQDNTNATHPSCDKTTCTPGKVALRPDKRPRPIVLRVNVQDCLDVQFTNLIDPNGGPSKCNQSREDGSATCYVGMHIQGLELRNVSTSAGAAITNDASWVGQNSNSLVQPVAAPGNTITYHYYAAEEGTFFLYAMDDQSVSQLPASLFGSINVEPPGAEYYRSQVTQKDLQLATANYESYKAHFKDLKITPRKLAATKRLAVQGKPVTLTMIEPGAQVGRTLDAVQTTDGSLYLPDGHPIIDYDTVFTDGPYKGDPVLNMLKPVPTAAAGTFELVYTDLTAIITGPYQGQFTGQSPSFNPINASPDRRQPYREFSVHYHQPGVVNIAFPSFITGTLNYVTNNTGGDNFGINYGIAGIAPEVFANRLGVGPVKDCAECKFEEFFLSSWPLGDPAMLVDNPACPSSSGCNTTNPATVAYYPDDPSNVYHSYLRDHVKFRIHNAANQAHVHHQHAHQWLHTPNSDDSLYLDSQLIVPGSSYTLEIAYGGSGNRNFTAGDSIFHCHFYPHFAQGMWALWRVHDTFESGTVLGNDGKPVPGSRAQPDGEIVAGTPIPAIVPLPTLGMAPLPAKIKLVDNGRRAEVIPDITPGGPVYRNPGYPFFVPGLAGHRAPHPPMDFAWEETSPGLPKLDPNGNKIPLDGGLPRHLIVEGRVVTNSFTRWDFSKDFIAYDSNNKAVAGWLKAFQLPENGTRPEIAAMAQHSGPPIQTFQPNGLPGLFYENGLPPVPGGPFANPDVGLTPGDQRDIPLRRYKAAVIQTDAVLNKVGWHYPQERIVTLWSDVQPTLKGTRPPQPFFFRADSGQSIEFWHLNLVPDYYQVDDFQVRTPTDIIGEHIHLVKFDVLASDGAANGFNYEDGTLSPDDVRNRIDAIDLKGGIYPFNTQTQWMNPSGPQTILHAKQPPPEVGSAPPGQNWLGAQTTVQRWSSDPLINHEGFDRTLRSVFTHDHFGPSTHQQAGLYAALLVEPRCSQWLDSVNGTAMGTQPDGGPTSWQAIIVQYANCKGDQPDGLMTDAYREFALEFQDLTLAYTNQSIAKPSNQAFQTATLFTTTGSYGPFSNGQAVPAALATELCNNGINLFVNPSLASCSSSNLKTSAILQNRPPSGSGAPGTWYIWNPVPKNNPVVPPVPATYQVYALTANNSSGASTQNVLTPYIEPGWADSAHVVSPPQDGQDSPTPAEPQPTLVSAVVAGTTPGAYSVNYRNEPVPLRVTPPSQGQSQPNATDLSYAYSSSVTRNNGILNCQPFPGGPITNPATPPTCQSSFRPGFVFPVPLTPGLLPGDPYTPLLRAYENDKVQVRVLTGAHVQPHGLTIHGVNWLFEPTDDTSGYHAAQGMGISEHFEMLFQLPNASTTAAQPFADYLYAPSSGVTGQTSGVWGIMRAYAGSTSALQPLPNNQTGGSPGPASPCPFSTSYKDFKVVAVTAAQVIEGGALVYNSRNSNGINPVTDPNALIFIRAEDVPPSGKIPANKVEPLVLRANAGDCIQITLQNLFQSGTPLQQTSPAVAPFGVGGVPGVTLNTSSTVGLHAGVVSLDVSNGDGVNVGMNPVQTVAQGGQPRTWRWFAGNRVSDAKGTTYTAMEFGAIGLTSSDPLLQATKGLVGALVIEPRDAKVIEDPNTHTSATVTYKDQLGQSREFREFVVVMQDSAENSQNSQPLNSGAINYRTEPAGSRFPTQGNEEFLAEIKTLANEAKKEMPIRGIKAAAATDPAELFSNQLVNGDPQTPVFTANAGVPVRFRVVYTGGDTAQVLDVHGHVWQEEPYVLADGSSLTCPYLVCSQRIGDNGQRSEWIGARQMNPNENADFVVDHAGGAQNVAGDYLYNTIFQSGNQGTWGLLRVAPLVVGSNSAVIQDTMFDGKSLVVLGSASGRTITADAVTDNGQITPLGSATVAADGTWRFEVENARIPRGAVIHIAGAEPGLPAPMQQAAGGGGN